MKTFIKTCTVAAMVLVFFGCEPEEDTVPLVVNKSFTESELMDRWILLINLISMIPTLVTSVPQYHLARFMT